MDEYINEFSWYLFHPTRWSEYEAWEKLLMHNLNFAIALTYVQPFRVITPP